MTVKYDEYFFNSWKTFIAIHLECFLRQKLDKKPWIRLTEIEENFHLEREFILSIATKIGCLIVYELDLIMERRFVYCGDGE